MAFLMDALSAMFGAGAQKQQAQIQADIAKQSLASQKSGFDTRLATTKDSNAKIGDLLNAGYAAKAGLNTDTFNKDLALNKSGFDENQTTASKAFSDQIDALGGLMTAQRDARLQQQDLSQAERARQLGFQKSADDLSAALPGDIGFKAQSDSMASAQSRRADLLAKNTSGAPAAYGFGGNDDPLIAAAFKAAADRGVGTAQAGNAAKAKLDSYGDAFQGSNTKLADFADAISGLTTKAEISRSALPDELGVGALAKSQAQQRYDFATQLDASQAAQREAATTGRTAGMTGAQNGYADAQGASTAGYYDTSEGAQNDFATALNGASSGLENATVGLNNAKSSGTTVTSPWATALSWGSKLTDDIGNAMMGMPSTHPAPVATKTTNVLPPGQYIPANQPVPYNLNTYAPTPRYG